LGLQNFLDFQKFVTWCLRGDWYFIAYFLQQDVGEERSMESLLHVTAVQNRCRFLA